jgi:MraZ protein
MLMLWSQMGANGELWAKMVLTGTYERTLDEKLRLAVPKAFRDALSKEEQLVLTPGTDGSLSLFTSRTFEAMARQLAERSPAGQDVRAFSRLLYSQSHSLEIDSQGRIRLPAELAKLASLAGDVKLVGVGDRIELWNKRRWEEYLAELQPRYDQLAETALAGRPQPASPQQDAAGEAEQRPLQPR